MRGLLKTVEKSLYSSDPEEQLIATKKIRQLLSVEREYLIDDVIAYDLIPRLLGFLKRDDESGCARGRATTGAGRESPTFRPAP